ncbi:peptidase T [Naegleria gruberi]|uniref:Peptidase T n=1 Tax=Naegleria gruberi TaxID=5762 RepID=D2V6W8_NAEGR|nr:peptidase T [Naegleria gruberi]EFC47645.1 peptidase T [Naegleria gruberi]|eukprot:XP_002680389.1 peptidase T [Naegleria gruberi]
MKQFIPLLLLLLLASYSVIAATQEESIQIGLNGEQSSPSNIKKLIYENSKFSITEQDWMRKRLEERFLHYVTFDTQSDALSASVPSTEKQLIFARVLLDELKALNLQAEMDQYGNVYAVLPGNVERKTNIGFLAHMDTATELSGANVKPIVHRNYKDGNDLVVNGKTIVEYAIDGKSLAKMIGHDIVTASGETLLGSDDKSGVAEMMVAVEYLVNNPSIKHGDIKIAFTIDEEIGRGPHYFNLTKFGADVAFTADGAEVGTYNIESFSADLVTLVFKGFNIHPGYSYGRMVNSLKVASKFLDLIFSNDQVLTPEVSKDRQGFIHCMDFNGNVDKSTIRCLLRAFDDEGLENYQKIIKEIVAKLQSEHQNATIETTFTKQYRNMRQIIDKYPYLEKSIIETYKELNIEEVKQVSIRGGTDGSQLSWMGLPTANIFAGGHNFHSTSEFVSLHDMSLASQVIILLAQQDY